MKFIKDEDIPFICKVTDEFKGSMIDSIVISTDDYYFTTIPISKEVIDKIGKRSINKIEKFIIKELKDLCQKKNK